jgi:hypothetical protein
MKDFLSLLSILLLVPLTAIADDPEPDFVKQIAPIFTKYCTGCHNSKDREGKLNLESFAGLQKGSENGVVLLSGQPDSSRLIRVLTGAAEPAMPPEGEKAPTPQEIALLKQWVEAGAPGPMGADLDRRILITPKISAAPAAERGVVSLTYSPDGKLLALGRFGSIELQDANSGATLRTLSDLPGKVNAIHFSRDGKTLVSASGISGLYGRATLWNVEDGKRIREIDGHLDILYDAELSPDGKLLATCSYDRAIVIWDATSGAKVRTLEGHNDAVYDVAFSIDGTVLASASGDKTIKLWKIDSGERLDTLSQPVGEQYAVTFSPDGKYFLAGGVDNRIRVWDFVSKQKAAINPLVHARFAHEGAVVALAFSPDGKSLVSAAEDRTIKRWETENYTQLESFERQPDQVVDIALPSDNQRCTVARLDGSLGRYPFTAQKQAADAANVAATTSSGPMNMPVNEVEDREPNDQPAELTTMQAPFKVRGTIAATPQKPVDVDLFRFSAAAGQQWMIEVNAARQKSPLDSKVEVLDAQGKPVVRMLLQAQRDSYFTFRGKDSDTSDDFRVFNWEEMEINEYLYANGEVVKLWHYPRGPDSGFIVYPGRGKRMNFFDTTPISHALGEPCYIVEPHPPGTSILPNGLPIFTLYFENDDDAWRQWGSDSRLVFTAPAAGEYLVRLSDARDFSGDNYKYELQVRPRKPDFSVKIDGANPTVGAGSGKEFTIQIERLDAFEGEITLDIEGLPTGFQTSAPITVQAGQTQALATINAAADAPKPTPEQTKSSKVFASAMIDGQNIRKEAGTLGEIKLADKPKVLVQLAAANEPKNAEGNTADTTAKPLELTLAPGQTITAKVKVERNGFNERVPFGNFDAGRNLPHGVFVDNIGLNGLMIVEGQTERIFFITAAKWVPEQTRKFHVQAQVEGNQTSLPVIVHIRRNAALVKQ